MGAVPHSVIRGNGPAQRPGGGGGVAPVVGARAQIAIGKGIDGPDVQAR